MGGAAYFSYGFILSKIDSNTVATLGAILVAVVVYLFFILWMRMFSQEDLALIPGGHILGKLQRRG
jgi:lipopolysaccharide export LptBFGC system permease protein LptF